MDYIIPHLDNKDMNEPDKRARINFFGQEGLISTRERIKKILDINHSVFQEDSCFADDILELFEVEYLKKDMHIVNYIPREYFRDYLTRHDNKENKNIHHIIFQNKILCGNKTNPYNHNDMNIGTHSSFHKLLNNTNLYPHKQISRFLRIEAKYLDENFMERIRKIEQSYEREFEYRPFEIYKSECFTDTYRRIHS